MPIVSIVFGALLIMLGVVGYANADHKSMTALIPAFEGGLLVLTGGLALKESLLKHAMHAAAMVGLLGLLGGLGNIVRVLVVGKDLWGRSGIITILMTVVSAAFVGLCVNSFIQARRRRQAAAVPQA